MDTNTARSTPRPETILSPAGAPSTIAARAAPDAVVAPCGPGVRAG